jgi:hypothetical protein
MDFNDLDAAEKAAIRALQRIGGRWPKTMRLISAGGGLSVAWSDGNGPDQLIASVPGVPLGGEWQRETADYWWYEFTPRRRDAQYARQEAAVRLLLHPALYARQRMSFSERDWEKFRESAARCGITLEDVQRTPCLPAEDVP